MLASPPSQAMLWNALYDYWAFLELIAFQGGVKSFADIHWELANFLQQPQKATTKEEFEYYVRRLIMMSRGYLKSTLLVGYVLWRVWRNPCIRVAIGTNISTLSTQFIREIRQYFEDPILREYVWDNRPHIAGKMIPDLDRSNRRWTNYTTDELEMSERKVIWNNSALQVVRPLPFKEPTLFSTSVETRLTGQHYDLIISDDVVDFKNSATFAGLRSVGLWCDDLENVVNKFPRKMVFPSISNAAPFEEWFGNEIIYCGTRYNPDDYYGSLLQDKDELGVVTFTRNIYKNGVDNTDGYNWSETMNEKKENYLRKKLGKTFYPQYLNIILSQEETILHYENIQWLKSDNISVSREGSWGYAEVTHEDGTKVDVRLMLVIDPAASLKEGACDSALGVGGLDENYNLYLFDVSEGKYTPSLTCKHALTMMKRWGIGVVTVETVGYQLALKHTLQDYFKENKVHHVIREYLPKGDKEKRIEHWLEPHFTTRSVYMHESLKSNGTLEKAIRYFGSAVPIDTIDMFAILREVARPGKRRKRPRINNLLNLPDYVTRFNKRWGGIY